MIISKTRKITQAKIALLLGGAIFLWVGMLVIFKIESDPDKLVVGFVSDIHAGDQSIRKEGIEHENVIFPNRFEKNFRKALMQMRDADLIFTLGDNLNRPSRKNTEKLAWLGRNYPIHWTKGNHDKLNHFQEILSKERYYFVDKKDWRIIVLDNSEVFPEKINHEERGRGYIDDEQLAWLTEALKTEKEVMILMHVPMLSRSENWKIREDYLPLQELFVKSGNVKRVFAGHYHVYDEKVKINNIIYHLVPSISLLGKEGYYYKVEI